jgi:hypothetical protein
LTEITAELGGGVGGAGGVFGAPDEEPPDGLGEDGVDDVDDVDDVPGPFAWKGSLLSKSENDCSCPVPAGGVTAATSCVEDVLVVAVGVPAPLSVGAAGSAGVVPVAAGVVVATVVAEGSAACGSDDAEGALFSDIIVCTANAIASASTMPSTITIFFCFSAFALAASATTFRATVAPLLAD